MRKAIKRVLGVDIGFDPIEGFVDLGHEVYVSSFGYSEWASSHTIFVEFRGVETEIKNLEEFCLFMKRIVNFNIEIVDHFDLIKQRIELYRKAMKELGQ